MLEPVLVGVIAAGIVFLPQLFFVLAPHWSEVPEGALFCILFAGFGLWQVVWGRRFLESRNHGLADLFIQIHHPSHPKVDFQWAIRGLFSWLLIFSGGVLGPEGAGIEWTYCLLLQRRNATLRWFEARRRTDVAMSLAGSIAAVWGAPFTGVLLPMELGIGGKNLSIVATSLSAFFTHQMLSVVFQSTPVKKSFPPMEFPQNISLLQPKLWILMGCIGLFAGFLGVLWTQVTHLFSREWNRLFRSQLWMKFFIVSLLFIASIFLYRPALFPSWLWMIPEVRSHLTMHELLLIICIRFLSLSLVVAGLGVVGIFSPLFVLGGLMSVCFCQSGLFDLTSMASVAWILGGGAWIAVAYRAPLAGAILVFELAHNNTLLFLAICTNLLAILIARLFPLSSVMDHHLSELDISLVEGRSMSILEKLSVDEAMAMDHETILGETPIATLHAQIETFKYPFLPVVTLSGEFLGLLTLEMVEEAWKKQGGLSRELSTRHLLEAQDLLYSSRFRVPTLQAGAPLSMTVGLFEQTPCIPILGQHRRVVGLLFLHQVRLAYDRAVMMQSARQITRERI